MKKLPILLAFLHGASSFSQQHSGFYSLDLLYGQKYLASNHFYGQLNTLYDYALSLPPTYMGIGYSGNFIYSRGPSDQDGHISYCQLVPQPVIVRDSVKTNLNGFIFSWGFAGKDLLYAYKNADLIFSFGLNTGRLRLAGNPLVRQKNPFFSPMVSFTPKILLWKIVLLVRLQYEFDVSNPSWKNTFLAVKDQQLPLNSIKQTGLSLMVGLGFKGKG